MHVFVAGLVVDFAVVSCDAMGGFGDYGIAHSERGSAFITVAGCAAAQPLTVYTERVGVVVWHSVILRCWF